MTTWKGGTRNPKAMRLLAVVALAVLAAHAAVAAETGAATDAAAAPDATAPPAPVATAPARAVTDPDRFRRFEDSYVIYNRIRNADWAGYDEAALRGHFSLKYSIWQFRKKQNTFPAEWFFSYTGEFDFYWGTRPSSPVINRINNPALHLRICDPCSENDPIALLDIALEHRSNGQVGLTSSEEEAAAARAAYDARDHQFFDRISRNANYLSFTTYKRAPFGAAESVLRTRLKIYLSEDSRIDWGPLAGRGLRFASYDRVNLFYRHDFGSWGSFELEWTVGDDGLKTDSITLGWRAQSRTLIPLYARLHYGPMNTLANYTQRQDSIGIGLRFDWWDIPAN